jgi:hypothetical protein
MVNRYLVLLEFLVNLNSHSVFQFEGKIKFIAATRVIKFVEKRTTNFEA